MTTGLTAVDQVFSALQVLWDDVPPKDLFFRLAATDDRCSVSGHQDSGRAGHGVKVAHRHFLIGAAI
jgi:hypothetical protein